MKILNINSYYYSSSVHRELQKAIINQGLNSKTYVPLAKGDTSPRDWQDNRENNIKISECYNYFDRYLFHLKHIKILRDIKQEISLSNYDCLHAHSLFSNGYIAMKTSKQYKIPYIVAVRGTDLNTFFKYMIHLRSMGVGILNNAEKVIFLSKVYRDFVIDQYIPERYKEDIYNKSQVIPNGINRFWFRNSGREKRLKNKRNIRLLHVGVINKNKNVESTIKSIRILKDKGYNVRLTVVGEVQDRAIFNKIKALDYVHYIKPQPKEELLKIYRDNDILVVPSISETFGLIYPEAMSQGLPVIYSRGQGFDGQIKKERVGYSVDAVNIEDIVDKIIKVIDNYEELSINSLKLYDKFDWEKISKKYINIYSEIYKR